MPKRKRRAKAKGKPRGKLRPRSKSTNFLPDRIVGFCLSFPFLFCLPILLIGGVVLSVRTPGELSKEMPKELHGLPVATLTLLATFVVLSIAAQLWASIRLWQGRRIGFIVCGLFALPGALYAIYEQTLPTGPQGSWWSVGLRLAWTCLIPTFCLARLVWWGPRPK